MSLFVFSKACLFCEIYESSSHKSHTIDLKCLVFYQSNPSHHQSSENHVVLWNSWILSILNKNNITETWVGTGSAAAIPPYKGQTEILKNVQAL